MQALKGGGMSVPEIAAAIGMSRRHVETRIALVTRLAPEVQAALDARLINLAQARELLPAPPDVQKNLVQKLTQPDVPDYVARPDAIRAAVHDDLAPVGRAIFDVSAAGLEIIEDLDGQRMMPRTPFLAAQKAAVEARLSALRGEYAWAKLTRWYSPHDWQHADDLGRPAHEGGAILVFNSYTGDVAEHLGLFEHEQPGAVDQQAAIARAQQERDVREEARKRLAAELSFALRPAHGLAAVMAALIMGPQHRNLLQVCAWTRDDEVCAAVARRLGVPAENATYADVFSGVARLEQHEIIDMLAELGRTLVQVSHNALAQRADFRLARQLGVTIPAALIPAQPDDDDD